MSWLNFLKAETREKKKKSALDLNSIFKYSHIVHRTHNHFIKKIKRFHGIIYIFKNNFIKIFLIFNKINCI